MPLNTFVTRLPIFDRSMRVYAYELVFRRGIENAFEISDSAAATEGGIAAWLFSFGVERLTGDRRGLIAIPRELLLEGLPALLDSSVVIVGIPDSMPADDEVVRAYQDLKDLGFTIAIDDMPEKDDRTPLIEFADIVRLRVNEISPGKREALEERFAGSGVAPLAGDLEASDQFRQCLEDGYQLFQGPFFAEPEIVAGKPLSVPKLHYLRLTEEVNRSEFSYDQLAEIVRRDAALSYKLLRYINSAAFGWRKKVQSIHHALVLLGEREIRRWATLAALGGTLEDRPQELLTSCVVRGRMCELLADRLGLSARSMDFFFLGMLSRFDQVMAASMDDVLMGIGISDDVREALVRPASSGALAAALRLVVGYEAGDWATVGQAVDRLGVDEHLVPPLYLDALEWSEALFRTRH